MRLGETIDADDLVEALLATTNHPARFVALAFPL